MHNGVDWKQAPRGARWWAVNADGAAYWYKAPDFIARTDFWFAEQVLAPTRECGPGRAIKNRPEAVGGGYASQSSSSVSCACHPLRVSFITRWIVLSVSFIA